MSTDGQSFSSEPNISAGAARAGELTQHRWEKTLIPLVRPAWLPESVWPFTTSALHVADDRIAVTDVGDGPVLLFVHVGLWSFLWRDVLLRLASDFRCVCFDAPGTGLSSVPSARAMTLRAASRALAAVVEGLELDDFTLVIHDLGGSAGLVGAAWFPERVRGIAAVNTFAWKPGPRSLRFMLALMGNAAMREFDVLTQLVPRITAGSFGVGRHMDKASRRAFLAGIGSQGVHSFHAYMRDASRESTLFEDATAALVGPFQRLPLVTIFGERNDPFGFQPQWKRFYPDAEQVVVARGNHFPMCDDPDLVARTLRTWHRERVAARLG